MFDFLIALICVAKVLSFDNDTVLDSPLISSLKLGGQKTDAIQKHQTADLQVNVTALT